MTAMIEDYTPIYVGDTGVPFAPVFQHKDTSPVILTGARFAMKLQNDDDGSIKICDPTQWTVDDALSGKAHYQWQAADVSIAGNWMLSITITVNGLPVHSDIKPLQILYAP